MEFSISITCHQETKDDSSLESANLNQTLSNEVMIEMLQIFLSRHRTSGHFCGFLIHSRQNLVEFYSPIMNQLEFLKLVKIWLLEMHFSVTTYHRQSGRPTTVCTTTTLPWLAWNFKCISKAQFSIDFENFN